MPSATSHQALLLLRDPSQFQWSLIPLLLLVIYVYIVELERRRWDILSAGLAFWGMDLCNEILNALFFHFQGVAPIWTANGPSSFLLLIGLNIEISLMFAVFGLVAVKLLPTDPNLRVLGLPNRWFFSGLGAALAVLVEVGLNRAGVLVWEHPWWNARAPWLIWLFGYMPFFLVAYYVFDMSSQRARNRALGFIFFPSLTALLIFGPWLHWI